MTPRKDNRIQATGLAAVAAALVLTFGLSLVPSGTSNASPKLPGSEGSGGLNKQNPGNSPVCTTQTYFADGCQWAKTTCPGGNTTVVKLQCSGGNQ